MTFTQDELLALKAKALAGIADWNASNAPGAAGPAALVSEAVAAFTAHYGTDSQELAELRTELGRAYLEQGAAAEGIAFLQGVVDDEQRWGGEGTAVAKAADALMEAYREDDDPHLHPQVVALLRHAVAVCEQLSGAGSKATFDCRQKLALTLAALNIEGEDCFKELKEGLTAAVASNATPTLIRQYHQALGEVHHLKGDRDAAQAAWEEALVLAETAEAGSDDIGLIVLRCNLGQYYSKLGQWEKCVATLEPGYQGLLKRNLVQVAEDTLFIADLQYCLGDAYEHLKHPKETAQYIELALPTYEARMGRRQNRVLDAKAKLAHAYLHQNLYTKATQVWEDVLPDMAAAWGEKDGRYICSVLDSSRPLMALQEWRSAIAANEAVLSLIAKSDEPNSPLVWMAHCQLGQSYMGVTDFSAAHEAFKAALSSLMRLEDDQGRFSNAKVALQSFIEQSGSLVEGRGKSR